MGALREKRQQQQQQRPIEAQPAVAMGHLMGLRDGGGHHGCRQLECSSSSSVEQALLIVFGRLPDTVV